MRGGPICHCTADKSRLRSKQSNARLDSIVDRITNTDFGRSTELAEWRTTSIRGAEGERFVSLDSNYTALFRGMREGQGARDVIPSRPYRIMSNDEGAKTVANKKLPPPMSKDAEYHRTFGSGRVREEQVDAMSRKANLMPQHVKQPCRRGKMGGSDLGSALTSHVVTLTTAREATARP